MYIVNGIGELFYIDMDFVIIKFLSDLKIILIFIIRMDFEWILVCIYCFMIIGDLLVGIVGIVFGKKLKLIVKINRYNINGKLI